MNKVLELSIRATIQYIEGNMSKFNEYRDKALKLHEEMEEKKVYSYPVKSLLPEEVENKLYELVS